MLKQIPISLTNLTEFSRVREPVSAGIPIPFEAAVTTPDLLALSDDQNQPSLPGHPWHGGPEKNGSNGPCSIFRPMSRQRAHEPIVCA